MTILVTGAAGFIGFHLVQRLIEQGEHIVGIDNINDYYDVNLKYSRLAESGIDQKRLEYGSLVQSATAPNYAFMKLDLCDRERLPQLFAENHFDVVVNLAAQAGVRYSIENPWAYLESNVSGFLNVLECCRHYPVKHLVYASSSSVYGGNSKIPFAEDDRVDSPVSLYAATKKTDELMASCYSKLYQIPVTGLRFFTVYGPWGRPDMSPMIFAKAIMEQKPIQVFNHGAMERDFTYIDDIIQGVLLVIPKAPKESEDGRREAVYNIGCSYPENLMDFIHLLENALGQCAEKKYLSMQPGDVICTYADVTKLERETSYFPHVNLEDGIPLFIEWFKTYYHY